MITYVISSFIAIIKTKELKFCTLGKRIALPSDFSNIIK